MSNMRTFSIFRYDPDEQSAAQMQTYHIELRASDRTLLNVLERIKAEDNSLAYRRSCREGNLRLRRDEYQRKNGLACLTSKGAGGPDPAAAFARLAGDS
ncbi:MAG: succinate dehydrogenase / fumarate reductase, iron-sulfur subunit [Paraburkholderia sp.]|nr:succinate dehydrogenase / fumarate reductase, iron-sulfur subunit [Paraburkholderia sp.]